MAPVTMKALLETGVHFGHRTRKWDPKMKSYIFTERNGIHIIDLQQTLKAVNDVYVIVRDAIQDGGSILFVGTKRQAQETIAREATRCNMPYVNERWLGGTLTNWRTIRQRIDYLKGLERRRDEGEFDLLTKKEALTLEREIAKLNYRLGGIREMQKVPNLIFVVDVNREYTAVHEANILKIPVIAMVDTNCDPDLIDYVIPSNDDAIRAIKLMASVMADAVLEGMGMRKDDLMEAGDFSAADFEGEVEQLDDEAEEEDFLGQATLAKLRSGELSFDSEETPVAEETADDEEEEEVEDVEEEAEAEEEEAEADGEEEAEAEDVDEEEAEADDDAEAEDDDDAEADDEDEDDDDEEDDD
jgi:small subunit ribosomal protein S2